MGQKMELVEEKKSKKKIFPLKLKFNKEEKPFVDVKDVKVPKSSKENLILWFKVAVSSMIIFMAVTILIMLRLI